MGQNHHPFDDFAVAGHDVAVQVSDGSGGVGFDILGTMSRPVGSQIRRRVPHLPLVGRSLQPGSRHALLNLSMGLLLCQSLVFLVVIIMRRWNPNVVKFILVL